eukprot:1515409-Pyramimonas_sp.AAC.1
MFRSVDTDGSGSIEFKEFVEVMTHMESHVLGPHGKGKAECTPSPPAAEKDGQKGKKKPFEQLPFRMVAMAYRRRKILNATF